ncbi:UNVERIFIED_CONTAM: hypothetical protein Sradi_7146400 [Sesamum radiatum]|uniref:Uncharacterized protein n=1 Tax=Sesamum radiatum TaxID=300843 RepID=A0AAW2IX73_SESRA
MPINFRSKRGDFDALASGLPIQPVLKYGLRSLTCVRVNGLVNPQGARKLTDAIPLRGAMSTDIDLLRRVRVSIPVGTRKMVNYA